jgi:hypothetical protein
MLYKVSSFHQECNLAWVRIEYSEPRPKIPRRHDNPTRQPHGNHWHIDRLLELPYYRPPTMNSAGARRLDEKASFVELIFLGTDSPHGCTVQYWYILD